MRHAPPHGEDKTGRTAAQTAAASAFPLAAALQCVIGIHLGAHRDFVELASVLVGRGLSASDLLQDGWRAQIKARALTAWPFLTNETGVGLNRDNWRAWLARRERKYGATVVL